MTILSNLGPPSRCTVILRCEPFCFVFTVNPPFLRKYDCWFSTYWLSHPTGNFRHSISLVRSKLSTQNEVQYIAKACRYNIFKNHENFSGQRWFQALKVGGAGFGNDQSLADYISGSQTSTNMGHGLTCRESRPKTYHRLNRIGHGCSCYIKNSSTSTVQKQCVLCLHSKNFLPFFEEF